MLVLAPSLFCSQSYHFSADPNCPLNVPTELKLAVAPATFVKSVSAATGLRNRLESGLETLKHIISTNPLNTKDGISRDC